MDKQFIKGLDLCEGFWNDVAKPLIDQHFPGLVYTSGLIGYGSDVLGYDDAVSTDHMWGPRFYLFLRNDDYRLKDHIMEVFGNNFPYSYQGYPVNFSEPDKNDHGVRHPVAIASGRVNPLVFVHTVEGYVKDYLGAYPPSGYDLFDWLSFSENRLLCLTSGRLFVDHLGVKDLRAQLQYYPEPVRLYLIASQSSLIAEEQAFVKRCASRDDDLGSRIVCMRILERIARLWFLYNRQYAPYSKWFGTALQRYCTNEALIAAITDASRADSIYEREKYLVAAQVEIGRVHNESGIAEPLSLEVTDYFTRDIKVIYADRFAASVQTCLQGTVLERLPLFGTMSQIGNFCVLNDKPGIGRAALKALYSKLAEGEDR